MGQDTETPAQPQYQLPGAVYEATRALLRLRTGSDARRIAEHLVRELGGWLVPAGTNDPRSGSCAAKVRPLNNSSNAR